jgi:hypothetical protein
LPKWLNITNGLLQLLTWVKLLNYQITGKPKTARNTPCGFFLAIFGSIYVFMIDFVDFSVYDVIFVACGSKD